MYKGKLIKGTEHSAGYDLCSTESLEILPGESKLVKTGLYLRLNTGTFGSIRERSGLACKGIHVHAGVIDCDWTDEVKVLLHNTSKTPFIVNVDSKIAQIIIQPYLEIKPLSSHGGFGSTGY